MLRPEDSSGNDEKSSEKVSCLQWDPLSTEYLLLTTSHSTILLIEASSASVVTYFELPSAAASVSTLSWIDSAPGMFLTGGLLDDMSLSTCFLVVGLWKEWVALGMKLPKWSLIVDICQSLNQLSGQGLVP